MNYLPLGVSRVGGKAIAGLLNGLAGDQLLQVVKEEVVVHDLRLVIVNQSAFGFAQMPLVPVVGVLVQDQHANLSVPLGQVRGDDCFPRAGPASDTNYKWLTRV
jgi:hypothetical protein